MQGLGSGSDATTGAKSRRADKKEAAAPYHDALATVRRHHLAVHLRHAVEATQSREHRRLGAPVRLLVLQQHDDDLATHGKERVELHRLEVAAGRCTARARERRPLQHG
jgi:muramidase (phage lysozyme)